MLKCDCGSTIPRSMCKSNEDGKLICPVCNKVEESVRIKVSLKKDGDEIEVPVSIQETNGIASTPTAEGLLNTVDNTVRSVFGDSLFICPECKKAICICSLKSFFKSVKL